MTDKPSASNFLRDIIAADLSAGRYDRVVTRFPPEPNGYLHIGHAKAICADFGLAAEFGGHCNLRMDDTNPLKEDTEYVQSIQEDVRWLGFEWGDHFFYAADYFGRLYDYAEELIGKGLAYVCSQDGAAMRRDRGTVTEPGTPSPDRDRPADESLGLFRRMRAGEFADGELTVRAKIDMAAPNMKLRDPPIYRIRHAHHHRTGDAWCIYPMYDFAHGLSDSIEGVTHSFCTLEFENNRALYDWFLDNLDVPQPRPFQYEFARLALTYTVMSKRKLLRLVQEGLVSGWDDPRMPTISGLRRRGYPAAAIRAFCDRIGVGKSNSLIDVALLEHAVRDELNRTAPRVMCVVDPLKLTVTSWPEGRVEEVELSNHPNDPAMGTRTVPFDGRLLIERADFDPEPPQGWRRLAPGREIRLKGAWFVTCDEVVRDASGQVVELRCSHDPATRGGSAPDGRKVKGTLHWLSEAHTRPAALRLVDRLFQDSEPEAGEDDFTARLNPSSMLIADGARIEAGVSTSPGDRFQFERQGYFCVDPLTAAETVVFNRVVPLRDTWAAKRPAAAAPKKRDPTPATKTQPSADELAALAPWTDLGVSVEAARMLHADPALAELAATAATAGADAKTAANLTANELVRVLDGASAAELPFGGAELAALLALSDSLNQRGLRAVLGELVSSGGEPSEIVARLGLVQLGADSLAPVVEEVLAAHPDEAARLRGGEGKLVGFLLGQVMRRTGGKADPKAARELLLRSIG